MIMAAGSFGPPGHPVELLALNRTPITAVVRPASRVTELSTLMFRPSVPNTDWADRLSDLVPYGADFNRLRQQFYDGGRWERGWALTFELGGHGRRLVLNIGPIKIVPYTIRQQP
jgi:hypothetical protein